jgi:uncharacterized protein (TIGR03437 family)
MRIFANAALLLTVIAATGRTQSVSVVANFADMPINIIPGSDGNLYGVTQTGGVGTCQYVSVPVGCGSIFEVTPAGVQSTLYSFQPGPVAAESQPFPNTLIQGTDGNFYGTTMEGGKAATDNCREGCGTIFKVTPEGTGTTLHAFDQTDGLGPVRLIEGIDGNLYGVTEFGGNGHCPSGCGTVFEITPQGSLTSLYEFSLSDGAMPADLIQGADGNFYGTTLAGGPGNFCPSATPALELRGCGTVFELTPAGELTTIYTFQGSTDSANPSNLIQTADGSFYGVASPPYEQIGQGGNLGSIFKLTPAGALTTLVVFTGTNGASPDSLVQASDGNIYGTTAGENRGVALNGTIVTPQVDGTLFQISPAGNLATLYDFCHLGCAEGKTIGGYSVILGAGQNLYGITNTGGTSGAGILFRYTLGSSTEPTISANGGVLNGASFQPGISPGSWITINGTNLSSQTDTWNSSIVNGALPTMLDGVSVMVGGQPAYIEYVNPAQINALAPNVPAGSVAVTVTGANGTSQAAMAQLSAEQPAFFQWGNYAVATHQDYTYAVKNGTFAGLTTVPAAPGDVIILWGTGFGPTSPAAPAGMETPSTTAYNTATTVSVTVGGKTAIVYGAALASGYAGLYQIAIQIPAGLANGDYPVTATINGVSSPSTTMITVQQ